MKNSLLMLLLFPALSYQFWLNSSKACTLSLQKADSMFVIALLKGALFIKIQAVP